MRYLASLLFLSLLFVACGEDSAALEKAKMEATEAAQEEAYDALIDGHDRVMPLMGQITALQRSIKAELKGDDLADDRKELLEAGMEQLEDAGDRMMEWMNGKDLDQMRAEMDNDGIMNLIKERAADIAKVEMEMTAAIAAGKEIMGDGHGHDHGDHGHDHGHDHDHGDHKH